jgi:hypothetical protein
MSLEGQNQPITDARRECPISLKAVIQRGYCLFYQIQNDDG